MSARQDPITGPVVPVFFHYAIPSVIGMLAVTSAGLIDGVFIGNFVGSTALAAVNIAQPTWAVFAALVFMLAVGGSVMGGKFLGEKNLPAASDIFTKTLVATVGVAAVFSGACLLWLDGLVALLGANEELHQLTRGYMRIILWFAPVLIAALTMDYFVRVDGRPRLAAAALVTFSLTNIVLNWLLIVRLGWGIEGAAWASALAELAIFLVLITHWFSPRCNLRLVKVSRGWSDVLRAAWNGLSEFTNEVSIGLIVLLFNWVMITRMGVTGVAAYTIVAYLSWVGLEIAYGISETLQPTVSKNLGARQPERIRQFRLTAMGAAFGVGLAVCLLFLLAPAFLVSLFLGEDEDATMAIALEFMALFWPAFLFSGMNITLSSYFTALHRPVQSAAIAITRSLVLPVVGLMVLPQFLGDPGIFLAIPVAEALTFVLALILVKRYPPGEIVQKLDA